MLLYNKLNAECWIIRAAWGYCPGLDLPLKKTVRQATSWLSWGGKPGKALLQDSFPLTAAFSSNWISAEAQSAFTNAYENVFFASPPFSFPRFSLCFPLVRFPCWKLMRLTGFWRNLMPRSFAAFINIEIIYQRTDKRKTASYPVCWPRTWTSNRTNRLMVPLLVEASDVGARCLSLPAGEGGQKRRKNTV